MYQFRRTFENEKHQLQELNTRLGLYVDRVKQLQQENAFLAKEINIVRQERTVEWENQRKAELRELRRTANQLDFEKSKAEMEREKLWLELQVVQEMYNKESGLCKFIEEEVKGCEKQLHQTLNTNQTLEERLFQLENEYKNLEDAQRQDIAHIRNQVYSRAMPVLDRKTYWAPTALTTEQIEEYAQTLSDCWTESLEIYGRKIEELVLSIRADEAKLEDLQREKKQYAAELGKLQSEAAKQNQLHTHLEEQIMNMQDSCHMELDQYQVMMEDLEEERQALTSAIAGKLRDHQELMQVKMGLSLEVAAYRALLEEESKDVLVWTSQHSRGASRRIDVKAPAPSYALKGSTVDWQDMKRHPATSTAFNIRYMESTSSRNPLAGRDMLSFASASRHQTATSSSASARPEDEKRGVGILKKSKIDKTMVTSMGDSQKSAKELVRDWQAGVAHRSTVALLPTSPGVKPNIEEAGRRAVRVVSPPMMSLVSDTGMGNDQRKFQGVKVIKVDQSDPRKIAASHRTGEVGSHFDQNEPEGGIVYKTQTGIKWDLDKEDTGEEMFPEEQKVLHSISMEDIIETVVKPVGLDTKLMASPESKVTYHVEKMEEEDGNTKTKIILQSKVEEELDMSDESALEELLGRGGKMVTLEDIKGTATGDMIQNLLSLGLQGGGANLENKSVNVEIIEEPVEDQSDEETKEKPAPKPFQSSSMFFQIEELENECSQQIEGGSEATKASIAGGNRVVELAKFPESIGETPYFTQVQETKYLVSTPDENASEPEEEGDFPSYGCYGKVDDWSDERYYQKEEPPRTGRANSSPNKDRFPECIIEEEIRVSPSVQETMLGILKQDYTDTKQQLKETLQQLTGTVSGPLRDDLDLFMKDDRVGSENLEIKKVQQASDNGKFTIVAELNVSQTLEDSELLGEEADASEEQIMAALQSCSPDPQHAISTQGGYTVSVSDDKEDTPWIGIEGQGGRYAQE